jgi:hypothetical protein
MFNKMKCLLTIFSLTLGSIFFVNNSAADIYEPFPCDGKRTPPLEKYDPGAHPDVHQKKTPTCWLCSTLPSLYDLYEKANPGSKIKIDLGRFLLFAGGGKIHPDGNLSYVAFQNIKNGGYQVPVTEEKEFGIQEVYDLSKFLAAQAQCETIDVTSCCDRLRASLPIQLNSGTTNLLPDLETELSIAIEKDPSTTVHELINNHPKRPFKMITLPHL